MQFHFYFWFWFFKVYFIDYAITVVPFFFSPLYPPLPSTPIPTSIPPFTSCPWVIHISSLASPFPILFLTSPCLFSTYHLCSLVLYSHILSLPLPTDNPPCDLHFCDFVPVLVVSLVWFGFWFWLLGSVVDSCEFVVIFLFIFFIFFFLDKSL